MAAPCLLLLFIFVLLLPTFLLAFDDRNHCNRALNSWSLQQRSSQSSPDLAHHLQHLLFFLHIPRTGGRTYHQCLLRHLYPIEQHCDRSYDKLRFNSSKDCKLLVTHADYSVLTKLPVQSISVATNMRDPIDRVFSAYEFSIEVASRFLARPAQSFSASKIAHSRKGMGASTLNIWPWSFLVPWMRADLFSRRTARESGEATASLGDIATYNASAYVMPLHEFIYQPIVTDLVHNGATFQVAGLTNNSYIEGAGYLRKCVIDYPDLGHHVLNVAKSRIDRMIFVGLTEKHRETATLFAHVVGRQVLPLGKPKKSSKDKLSQDSMLPPSEPSKHIDTSKQFSTARPKENLTVYGLIEIYENCADRTRQTQVQRRGLSMRKALPVNFSNEARVEVAEEILEKIRQLNSLDLELHRYAQHRFSNFQVSTYENSETLEWPKDRHSHLIVEERVYQWHSPWSGSEKLMFLMVLSVGGGMSILGVALFVFFNKNRFLKLQTGRNHAAHQKI